MPKSSQKPAGAEQSMNQRGKNRFGSSGRARVVLPERPPRAVDNEIVSILLGADPALLVGQVAEAGQVTPQVPAAADQPNMREFAEAAPPADKTSGEPVSIRAEELTGQGDDTQAVEISSPIKAKRSSPATARRLVAEASPRRAERPVRPVKPGADAEDRPISSFEEFAERWRHGLRKGQLKICEVLYQKTYAVGQTECVTSFSEMGRLSGLKMRQCFNIIAQLEALKFVERSKSAGTSNKKDQGSVIRFHLFPVK